MDLQELFVIDEEQIKKDLLKEIKEVRVLY